MDCVCPTLLCQGHNLIDGQIGSQGSQGLAHNVGLVGLSSESAENVLFRVNRYGVQSKVMAGPDDANRNLATVRHQNLLDFLFLHKVFLLKTQVSPVCRTSFYYEYGNEVTLKIHITIIQAVLFCLHFFYEIAIIFHDFIKYS